MSGVGFSNSENGTYLQILYSGYYYVYTQVTFNTDGSSNFCYNVIRRQQRGDGDESPSILMSCAMQTQQSTRQGKFNPSNYEDSKYLGGVFPLKRGQMLAVQPMVGYYPIERTFRFDSKKSFFGIFLLSPA